MSDGEKQERKKGKKIEKKDKDRHFIFLKRKQGKKDTEIKSRKWCIYVDACGPDRHDCIFLSQLISNRGKNWKQYYRGPLGVALALPRSNGAPLKILAWSGF